MRTKLFAALLLAFVVTAAGAQGVVPKSVTQEHTLFSWWFNAAAATATCPAAGSGCAGHVLPPRSFTITALSTYVSVISGGGGGVNTVIQISDGTNTCNWTLPCTTSAVVGAKRVATANGAGSGCTFPGNAVLQAAVVTAGCTTTQPTLRNIDFQGRWN